MKKLLTAALLLATAPAWAAPYPVEIPRFAPEQLIVQPGAEGWAHYIGFSWKGALDKGQPHGKGQCRDSATAAPYACTFSHGLRTDEAYVKRLTAQFASEAAQAEAEAAYMAEVERRNREDERALQQQYAAAIMGASQQLAGDLRTGLAEVNARNAALEDARANLVAARQREAEVAAQELAQRQADDRAAYAQQQNIARQQAAMEQDARAQHQRAAAADQAYRQSLARTAPAATSSGAGSAAAASGAGSAVASAGSTSGRSAASGSAGSARTASGDIGEARLGEPEKVVQKAPPRPRAKAWCMKKQNGEFWCNGPLQNGGWGKELKGALGMVDCSEGSGYTPTVGTGGQSFDCGRELKSYEKEMPLYDPFARSK
jgi:hypothetical protein